MLKNEDQPIAVAAIADSPRMQTRFPQAAAALLIAGLTVLLYLPSLHGAFILDDDRYLTDNPLIFSPHGLSRFWFTTAAMDYYPVSNTSLWLEWRLWGMNPTGYRTTNVLLHIATALLVWRVLQRLSIRGAYLAALLWAIHPINLGSAAWIAQRKEVLAALFFVLSIFWYLRAEEGRAGTKEKRRKGEKENWGATDIFWLWYCLSLGAFVLAMLSKGSIATLPLVLLLIGWWLHGRITARDFLQTVPFFLIAVPLTLVHVWYQAHGDPTPHAGFFQRLAGAGGVVWFYLAKALAPIHLSFMYPQWHVHSNNLLWWLPLAMAAGVTVLLWLRRNSPQRNWVRSALFAWLFFCLALAPMLGFAETGGMKISLVANQYAHVAIVGVTALVAAAWSFGTRQFGSPARQIVNTLAVAMVGVLSMVTWQYSKLYGDPVQLFQASIDRDPQSYLAEMNLGIVLAKSGRTQDALEHCAQAVRINPEFAEARNDLGNALANTGHTDEAIEQYRQALRLNPNYAEAHYNLGIVMLGNDQNAEAAGQFQQAVQAKPEYFEAHLGLGVALAKSGHVEKAIEQFEQTVEINPDCLDAYANLTTAYAATQRRREAIAAAEKAVALARSRGNVEIVQQIERWLANYRFQPSKAP